MLFFLFIFAIKFAFLPICCEFSCDSLLLCSCLAQLTVGFWVIVFLIIFRVVSVFSFGFFSFCWGVVWLFVGFRSHGSNSFFSWTLGGFRWWSWLFCPWGRDSLCRFSCLRVCLKFILLLTRVLLFRKLCFCQSKRCWQQASSQSKLFIWQFLLSKVFSCLADVWGTR